MGFGGTTNSTVAPRVGALTIQSSSYGLPIPLVWGTTRLNANMIWYSDFVATPHTSTQSSGGKGGGVTTKNTTFTYTAALAMALCEGVILGVPRVWAGKEVTSLGALGFALFTGTAVQSPWSFLSSRHPADALNYPSTVYVAASAFSLGDSAQLPNMSFEVSGPGQMGSGIVDANPAQIVSDFLTSSVYGAGFPSALLDVLTNYDLYTKAAGLFVSPLINAQQSAAQHLDELLAVTNSAAVWSEKLLKVIPYGDTTITGNGVTFTPNVTAAYNLTDDDFLQSGNSDPVRVKRKPQPDAYNAIQVEYLDRAHDYNVVIAEAKDQANIDLYGLRTMAPVQMHAICDGSIALAVATLTLQRELYIRNTYEFKLGWKYARLEPMDVLTLTHSLLGLALTPVRITAVDEDESGGISIIAEEFPSGVASPTRFGAQAVNGYSTDFNVAPGGINAPVIFEPPHTLTGGTDEAWMAISGGPNWGGCDVWASDDNSTYVRVGTVYGPARSGLLTASIATGLDPDTINTLAVDIAASRGQLLPGTTAQADMGVTLCYVQGEYLSYRDATLTSAGRYTLGYLRRGRYGSTISAHNVGDAFARVDESLFKMPISLVRVGQPVYLKFVSRNIFGGGQEDIATVPSYTYTIQGTAISAPLPSVVGLVSFYRNGQILLSWQDVVVAGRTIDYEIRKGTSYATALILGKTTNSEFYSQGDDTYWVSAHSSGAYSTSPTSIVVTGSTLVKNVVVTWDEAATSWTGTVSGGATVSGLVVQVTGAAGEYTIPGGHEVDIGSEQPCNCTVSYSLYGDSTTALFSLVPLVSALASFFGNYSDKVSAQIQIAVAPISGTYGAWKDFYPGTYVGRKFKFKAKLASSDATVRAILSAFRFTVDIPDKTLTGNNVAIAAAGNTITFASTFQVPPNVQITIRNASTGDVVILSAVTTTGFTVQVTNAGAGVARNINWLAQGY